LLEDISAETAHAREARAELYLLENALNTVAAPLEIFDGLAPTCARTLNFNLSDPKLREKTALKNPFPAAFSFGKNSCCHMTPGTKCADQS
jgi:hypothetical protein